MIMLYSQPVTNSVNKLLLKPSHAHPLARCL